MAGKELRDVDRSFGGDGGKISMDGGFAPQQQPFSGIRIAAGLAPRSSTNLEIKDRLHGNRHRPIESGSDVQGRLLDGYVGNDPGVGLRVEREIAD